MSLYEKLIQEIKEWNESGYEVAVYSEKTKRIKFHGSLISDECELPDIPKNCKTHLWNNTNIFDLFPPEEYESMIYKR